MSAKKSQPKKKALVKKAVAKKISKSLKNKKKTTSQKKQNAKSIKRDSKSRAGAQDLNEPEQRNPGRDPDAYIQAMRQEQGYMSLGDHLEELRIRMFRIVIYIAVMAIVLAFVYDDVYRFIISGPLQEIKTRILENSNPLIQKLEIKEMHTQMGGFFMTYLKVILLGAGILAIPLILFEFWGFIMPALDRKMRKVGNGLLLSSVLLFWGGVLFARYTIFTHSMYFMIANFVPAESIPDFRPEVGTYLSLFFVFHFSFGLAFQLPIISVVLALIGILKSSYYIETWRYSVVVIAAASAFLTPSDPWSMIALMIPLYILYFFSAILVKLVEKKDTRPR